MLHEFKPCSKSKDTVQKKEIINKVKTILIPKASFQAGKQDFGHISPIFTI